LQSQDLIYSQIPQLNFNDVTLGKEEDEDLSKDEIAKIEEEKVEKPSGGYKNVAQYEEIKHLKSNIQSEPSEERPKKVNNYDELDNFLLDVDSVSDAGGSIKVRFPI
jgi:hypothetical protein